MKACCDGVCCSHCQHPRSDTLLKKYSGNHCTGAFVRNECVFLKLFLLLFIRKVKEQNRFLFTEKGRYQSEDFRGMMCGGSMGRDRKRMNTSLSFHPESINTVASQ